MNNKKTNNNIFNINTCNYTKNIGSPSTTLCLSCTQEQADQATDGTVL